MAHPTHAVPNVQVRYGPNLFAPTSIATGTWYPADWCPFCGPGLPGFDNADIAVIKLDAPHPLSEYVSLPSLDLSDSLPNNQMLMISGYGVNGFTPGGGPLAANANFDGLRRFDAYEAHQQQPRPLRRVPEDERRSSPRKRWHLFRRFR